MKIRCVYLAVENLEKSIAFYSSFLGEEAKRKGERADFPSGISLFSVREWKKETGLPPDFRLSRALSSSVVLETEDFNRILINIQERGLIERVLNIEKERIILLDEDLNMVIIIPSSREMKEVGNVREEKTTSVFAMRS